MSVKWYPFEPGLSGFKADLKNPGLFADAKVLIGGKGAGLHAMAQAGLPVPPGIVLPVGACADYNGELTEGAKAAHLEVVTDAALTHWGKWAKGLGYFPLVSVRSGAAVSMPGMMDTILNVGMCDKVLRGWAERIGQRGAVDSYRRLIQMYGTTVHGIKGEKFDAAMAMVCKQHNVPDDQKLDVAGMAAVVDAFKAVFEVQTGHPFPQDREEQLSGAIEAVWKSWDCERAVHYRKQQKITGLEGTAVTVQQMVFGNMDDKSGSGVLFTRNPSSGENVVVGEFLPRAQGEDVVAGIRTPMPLAAMGKMWPAVTKSLLSMVAKLEKHYRDVQDVEFTIQSGKLYLLQTRTAKRAAGAAVKIAVDMVGEKLVPVADAVRRVTPRQFFDAQREMVDPSVKAAAQGLAACPGVATGVVVAHPSEAVALAAKGKACILVREETTPDDIMGMTAAKGVLTMRGGVTSHAAVVARALDKPCVVGCTAITMGTDHWVLNGASIEGKVITIDGLTGNVYFGTPATIGGENAPGVAEFGAMCLMATEKAALGPVPMGGWMPTVVRAACWQTVDEAKIAALLANETKHHVYVDLRPARAMVMVTADLDLWQLERHSEEAAFVKDKTLAADAAHWLRVGKFADLMKYPKRVTMFGWDDVPHGAVPATFPLVKPATLAELLKGGKMVVQPSETLIEQCGGSEGVERLLKLLAMDKKNSISFFEPPPCATPEDALFELHAPVGVTEE